ncbi:type II toxin-antitoxin system VapC family toxin [Actinacidiphila oryziradicis]|uniref:Ribonuclease VapC n=1 Tax=Actinacidiphila oryziradicis TaxID=2571141 RepID=A0A4U0SR69_9ACTN|nr:type II toxin-antitoxin system VapC family toxin [Actinacidiphila oryziradicis]
MGYLLDTNVLSEVRKRNADHRVLAWMRSTRPGEVFTSALVIGEIRRGAENVRRRDPAMAERLDMWLARVRRDFGDKVLPVTAEVAEAWGRQDSPDRLPAVDGLLAATAKVHDLVLVTRNIKDVERADVRLVNPFEFGV